MEKILEKIGLSPLIILFSIFCIFIFKEIWTIFKTYRIKTAHEYFTKLVDDIDNQLKEFYLPLRERFMVSKMLFDTTRNWLTSNEFNNSVLQIETDDPKALRKIVVWKLFLPFNLEIEKIILEKLYRKNIDDNTNYEKILHHFIIWKSFEEAIQENLISYYDAEDVLQFPAKEVNQCIEMCNKLLENRNQTMNQILKLGRARKGFLLVNKLNLIKGERDETK